MNICNNCVLPETFPGLTFDEQGICSYCRKEEAILHKSREKRAAYREKLNVLVREVKGKGPNYDAIVAYSGGKDSSYTVKILRDHYDLRMIALTFDNHFVSPFTWDNIRNVLDNLGVDQITFKPPWEVMRSTFSLTAGEDIFAAPTLLRASSMCTACITIIKSLILKTALEMQIPLVAFGWSPGQAPIQSAIMKTNRALIRQNQRTSRAAFPPRLAKRLERYFLPESYYQDFEDRFPINIHPLAFFDYDEKNIMKDLNSLGWRHPTNTDTNSTNCLLNAFANERHIERHRFHPYVWEIANMVRQGVMTREEGMEKIYSPQDPGQVAYAREKLGL
jgi:tRNA(Ile)-lysidine synthase TilS/MesJ